MEELKFDGKNSQVRGLKERICYPPRKQLCGERKWWKGEGHVVKRQYKGWMKQGQELQIMKQLLKCKH